MISFQWGVSSFCKNLEQKKIREGEAPAEPLAANGSPGGSPSHTLTKTSKDFLEAAQSIS